MWVVTCGANKSLVAFSPAAALLQTISGKADNSYPGIAQLRNVPPGAMARTAKIHGSGGIQGGWIEDQSWICAHACMSQRYVSGTWTVAALTRDSRHGGGRREFATGYGSSSMTAEAEGQLVDWDGASQCSRQGFRDCVRFSGGHPRTKPVEDGHVSLPPFTDSVVNERLSVVATAENPRQRSGERLLVVADAINQTVVFVANGILRRTNRKIRGSNLYPFLHRNCRTCHGVFALSFEQFAMALSADARSYVRTPWRISLARPPTRLRQMVFCGHLRRRRCRHFSQDRHPQEKDAYKHESNGQGHMRAAKIAGNPK